mmetsp:Transcript_37544/g.63945  ORF Transcript_37544/g.63945 Transcript_37544/m.63945 type:complete len:298 (+) Transcript_37544:79-972(+)
MPSQYSNSSRHHWPHPPRRMPALFALIILLNSQRSIEGFAPSMPIVTTEAALPTQKVCAPIHINNPQRAASSSSSSSTNLFVGRGMDDSNTDRDVQLLATSSNSIDDTIQQEEEESFVMAPSSSSASFVHELWKTLTAAGLTGGGPPLQIDDVEVLLYDVFLLMNLSLSISYLVVHRWQSHYIPSSIHEGAVLSICWIAAGLLNGIFLHSAIDGHYDPRKDAEEYERKGGPGAAGLLALSTFVTTSSLRIVLALGAAVAEHRPVGSAGEELMPLETLFGLVLMSAWRCLHSEHTPRI